MRKTLGSRLTDSSKLVDWIGDFGERKGTGEDGVTLARLGDNVAEWQMFMVFSQ